MTTSVAFVTKSYAPDLERCELLCRSIELLAPGHEPLDHRRLTRSRCVPAPRERDDSSREDRGAAAAASPEAGGLRHRQEHLARRSDASDTRLARAATSQVRHHPPGSRGRAGPRRFRHRPHSSVSGGDARGREWCASVVPRPGNCRRGASRSCALASDGRATSRPPASVPCRCPTTSAAWFRGVGKSPSHCSKRSRLGRAVTGCARSPVRGTSRNTCSTAGTSRMRSTDRTVGRAAAFPSATVTGDRNR